MINGPASAHHVEERPTSIEDFNQLYSQNCSACHGAQGRGGPAIAMNNPVYLAVATAEIMQNDTVNGGPGAQMPAFGQSAGGLLTDAQIHVIVDGMRQRWSNPGAVAGATLPAYAATHSGDVAAGAQVYAQACARCHGAANGQSAGDAQSGNGQAKSGSVIDPTFLALISDQGLRSVTIAGRPELGMPDYRSDVPGKPLTDAQITDVVAWMSSHRQTSAGVQSGSNVQPSAPPAPAKKVTSSTSSKPGKQAAPMQ